MKTVKSGDTLWVMSFSLALPTGSVRHVTQGAKLYRSQAECQKAIDEMEPWIGMGDRNRYRPLSLVVE